jgi:hypothetical protein
VPLPCRVYLIFNALDLTILIEGGERTFRRKVVREHLPVAEVGDQHKDPFPLTVLAENTTAMDRQQAPVDFRSRPVPNHPAFHVDSRGLTKALNGKTTAFHPTHMGVRKIDVAQRASLHARPPEPNQFAETTSEPTD